MRVLIDTSAWSVVLRRRPERLNHQQSSLRAEILSLAREKRVAIFGAVRQELLSGLHPASEFTRARDYLRAFEDEVVTTADHERAAEFFNLSRSRGVQGSQVDFLICAVAEHRDLAILSTDPDFERYALHIPIRLHVPRDMG